MEKGALIGRGRTADVYAWGEDRVLKLFQSRMPYAVVEQEFNATRYAWKAGVPVPAVDGLVEIEGLNGIVFERLVGPSMLKTMQRTPWMLFALARRFGELQAAIHACRPVTGLPAQRQQIQAGIQASKDLPERAKAALIQRLNELPDDAALCHGDFHPDNILMTPRGPVIIDWPNGTAGQPVADVARTIMVLQTSAFPPGIPRHMVLILNASRRLFLAAALRRYSQIQTNQARQALRLGLDAWKLPLMAARLREVENYPREKEFLLARIQSSIA